MRLLSLARPHTISDARSKFSAKRKYGSAAGGYLESNGKGWGEGARYARGVSGRKPDLTTERSGRRTSTTSNQKLGW